MFILTDCQASKRAYEDVLGSEIMGLGDKGGGSKEPLRYVLTLNEFV